MQCFEEPTLDEMLADPLIGAMMNADGVDPEQLGSDLARIAEEQSRPDAA